MVQLQRTISGQQQKIPNFQKGKPISLECMAKDKDIKKWQRISDGDLCSEGGSHKLRKNFHILRNPFTSRAKRELWNLSGLQWQGLRGQNRKFITEITVKQHFSVASPTGGLGWGAATWAWVSDRRERSGGGYCEDTLRGLLPHNGRSREKKLGCLEC